MEKLEVFRAALGLSEPWQVTSAEFDAEQGQLDVYLDFARGAQFPGPEGDEDACPVHDTGSKTWRHSTSSNTAPTSTRASRVHCPAHGVR